LFIELLMNIVSDWLLFKANSAIFQLSNVQLQRSAIQQVNFQCDDDEIRFVPDQHAELDCYSANSLKQQ
jgi:hypothetical protein